MKWLGLFTGAALAALAGGASAAELKCLFPGGVKSATSVLVPQFEQKTKNKAAIEYLSAGGVADKVKQGAEADVAISTEAAITDLEAQGKVLPGTRTAIAKVGIAIFVKKGAPKPDIKTVDSFKRALLAAKSFAYTDPTAGGPAGKYVGSLLEKLGLAADVKAKQKLTGPGEAVAKAVVEDGADFGFLMISEILHDPRLEMVGPLPAEIQNYTKFSAGILASSKQQAEDKALLSFLTSPEAKKLIVSKGFELF